MSLSVIIPFKNNLAFLEETLHCFLNQSVIADEIIVVNDHSEELSEEFIIKYKNDIIFARNTGSGACDARNTGFNISTGSFIKFFDSDDILTKTAIEHQYNQLLNSNKGLIYGPVVKVFRNNNHWEQLDSIMYYSKYKSTLPFDKLMLRGFSCGLPQCMIKRDVFKDAGLWESGLKSRQDVEFMFRIAQVEPHPIHENKSCLFYRQHNNQITVGGNSPKRLADDLVVVLAKIRQHVLKNTNYSFTDRFFIESRILSNNSSCSDSFLNDIKETINSFNMISKMMGKQYLRAANKLERIRTKSPWDSNIGPCTSIDIFNSYLTNI